MQQMRRGYLFTVYRKRDRKYIRFGKPVFSGRQRERERKRVHLPSCELLYLLCSRYPFSPLFLIIALPVCCRPGTPSLLFLLTSRPERLVSSLSSILFRSDLTRHTTCQLVISSFLCVCRQMCQPMQHNLSLVSQPE